MGKYGKARCATFRCVMQREKALIAQAGEMLCRLHLVLTIAQLTLAFFNQRSAAAVHSFVLVRRRRRRRLLCHALCAFPFAGGRFLSVLRQPPLVGKSLLFQERH